MKKMMTAAAGLAFLFSVGVAAAQTRPMGPSQGKPSGSAPGAGQQSEQHMMGQMGQGMGMMCPMMGMGSGMMGGGMMGGGMMAASDPKSQARMLKLRGDLMKAMGDVMLQHAQEIEQTK